MEIKKSRLVKTLLFAVCLSGLVIIGNSSIVSASTFPNINNTSNEIYTLKSIQIKEMYLEEWWILIIYHSLSLLILISSFFLNSAGVRYPNLFWILTLL